MIASTLALVIATSQANEMRMMRYPAIHGDTIAFTYANDLWIADRNNGAARRLTSSAGAEIRAHFSPDGKWLAFTGTYDGNPDVYIIPVEGGEPTRLTYEPEADLVCGWTPDGMIAYVTSQNSPGSFTPALRLVSPQGGLPKETKLTEVFDCDFSPDGKQVVFCRSNSHSFNWRRYRGGTQGRISFSDTNASFYSEVPSGRENSWQPMWVGDSVYYISDKTQNTRNIWSYDTKSKQVRQLTNFGDADIKWPSSDGKRIIFEKNGYLLTYDIATHETETLHPSVRSEMLAARPALRNLSPWIHGFSLSPTGNRIAIEARGEIFSVPAHSGDTRNLTGQSSESKESAPAWSPDGKTIAYLSDKTGEVQIYTQPQMGGEVSLVKTSAAHHPTNFNWSPDGKKISYSTTTNELFVLDLATGQEDLVFQGQFGNADNYDWSPDSKWIAYVDAGPNLFGAISIYSLDAKKSTKVTEGYFRDDSVTFDLNGKYLYLLSLRTFNPVPGDFEEIMQMEGGQRVYVVPLTKDTPNPLLPKQDEEPAGEAPKPAEQSAKDVKIDFDGLADRAIPLPWPAGSYNGLFGDENGVYAMSGGTLKNFDLNSRQGSTILSGFQGLAPNYKRNKIAYIANGTVGIIDAKPDAQVGQGRVDLSQLESVIDPKKEWKQIFWEAWRYERDRYYDKDMLGLDWNAIGKQYAAYLPYVAHRADLNYVLGLMLSELGTGHAYVQGGDLGPSTPLVPVGALGADYAVAGNKLKFKKIYRGFNYDEGVQAPLGGPGVDVREGDYLLIIDGHPVDSNTSPHSLLVGKANRYVTLKVAGNMEGVNARTVRVKTLASEKPLRYQEWVETNRRKVGELSHGRIGYMHVPNTSEQGMVGFTKGFYSQSDKEALIVDERFNGGGNIPTFFIEKLQRHTLAGFRQRNGSDVFFPNQAIDGPKCMLINQYAGSGGDLFPWFFKTTGLGPLIGKRTWGGLVGITGYAPFVDGGGVSAPEFGLYDPVTGKWIAENTGIDPDIDIDARPDQLAMGRDPQLEKAVEYLMGELAKGKKPTKRPDFPRVKTGGGK